MLVETLDHIWLSIKHLIRLIICLFGSLLFTSACSHANAIQIDTIDTQPYTSVLSPLSHYFGHIKNKIDITRLNKMSGLNEDTSSVKSFDRNGKLKSAVLFNRNKRQAEYRLSYYRLGRTSGFIETSNENNQATTRFIDTLFNDDKTIAALTQKVMVKNDTLYRYSYLYSYDKSKHLIKKVYKINNTKVQNYSELTYIGDRLKSVKFVQNPVSKDKYVETIFEYDQNNRLIKQERYDVRNTVRILIGFRDFFYKGNKLVNEKYGTYDRMKDVTWVTYNYLDNGKISLLTVKKDSLAKTVTYTYQGLHLSKVHVESNTSSGLDREFSTQLWLYSSKKFPIVFDVEYLYDTAGNLTDTKYFVNNDLKGHFINQFSYY